MEDDWPRALLLQRRVDVPDQLLALFLVALARLPAEQLFELAIAVPGKVAVRIARITLVELLIVVVDDGTTGVFEGIVRPVAQPLHDLAGFLAVFLHIGVIAWQRSEP